MGTLTVAGDRTIVVGRFEYTRRNYTPKRGGWNGPAGHGWIRNEPHAEVGQEVCLLVDEIVRLRALSERDGARCDSCTPGGGLRCEMVRHHPTTTPHLYPDNTKRTVGA